MMFKNNHFILGQVNHHFVEDLLDIFSPGALVCIKGAGGCMCDLIQMDPPLYQAY